MTDVLLNPGSPTNLGTGNAQASETVINLVGSSCAATGHSGSVGPTSNPSISNLRGMYNTVTSIARGTNKHLHVWVRDLYPIRNVNIGGVSVYLFTGTESAYFVTGLDKGYAGGWYHAVLDLTVGALVPSIGSISASGGITRVGYLGNISASKGEDFLQNCYLDAIRTVTGAAVRFTGGTSGDPFGFADMAVADTASYGIVRNIAGATIIEGGFEVGNASANAYTEDSLLSVTFTDFTINNGTGGNSVEAAVQSDFYTITANTGGVGFVTSIIWNNLTFSGAPLTPANIAFGNLVAGRDVCDLTGCTFINFESILLPDNNSAIDDCTFLNLTDTLVPGDNSTNVGVTFNATKFVSISGFVGGSGGAVMQDCTIVNQDNTGASGYMFLADGGDQFVRCDFTLGSGLGGAIGIFVAGTYTFEGNTFSGYGGTPGSNLTPNSGSSTAAIVNLSGGLVTLNITGGGDVPSVRNGGGATTVVNLSVPVTVTVQDSEGNPIQGAKVFLETTPGGTDLFTYGITDASGQVTTTYGGTTPQDVVGYVAKGTASPVYKRANINDTISSTGLATTITMVLDE